jgi:hypothetical protein
MVEKAGYIPEEQKSGYSELKVLQSAAGYYVGTTYFNPDFGGFEEPGSRDSGYYRTEGEAERALKLMTTFNTGTRDRP